MINKMPGLWRVTVYYHPKDEPYERIPKANVILHFGNSYESAVEFVDHLMDGKPIHLPEGKIHRIVGPWDRNNNMPRSLRRKKEPGTKYKIYP